MKYLKKFENINSQQQPFYLYNDKLYLSNKMVERVYPSKEFLMKKYNNNKLVNYLIKHNYEYIKNVESKYKYIKYKQTLLNTGIEIKYNNIYSMKIILKRRNKKNEFGDFNHYLSGISGDFETHKKGMIRATKECNLKFMILYYPIIEHIKNFYKRLKNNEAFLDIIEESIIDKPKIAKYGVPDELFDKYGYLQTANDYNL